ncbi:MAG: hypothetical protein OXI87_01395 [Albidovulum sp.]|nr:hypothetical protein [Albidovulum sp.]MDE0303529.1 hypothetical protein [Albidovulum sp.]
MENPARYDHDLGLLFLLSCVANFKLTGNEHSRRMPLKVADFFAVRWRRPMPFLMCWKPMRRDTPEFAAKKTRTESIDCMHGMSLLYWANRETGQSSFADIANMHNNTAIK